MPVGKLGSFLPLPCLSVLRFSMTRSLWHLWVFQPWKLLFKRGNQRNKKNIHYCWKGMSGLLSSKVKKEGGELLWSGHRAIYFWVTNILQFVDGKKIKSESQEDYVRSLGKSQADPALIPRASGSSVLNLQDTVLVRLFLHWSWAVWVVQEGLDSHSQINTWEKLSLDLLHLIRIQWMSRRNGSCVVLFRLWCGFKQVEFTIPS